MTELRPLDSGFMELEDADRHISLGIGAVAIIAGAPPGRPEFSDMVARSAERNPRLRQKVRRAPLDLATPVWEDDPDFDVTHHIRWTALPTPGDDPALCELVAAELEERLDRDHPLWQCVVVEHLAGDRWALFVKAHHSLVDGVSGISVFRSFCDPVPGEPDHPRSDTQGRRAGMRWLDAVRGVTRLPVVAPRSVLAVTRGLAPVVSAVVSPAAESSLNDPIGRQRRYAMARAALSDVHDIGAAFGVTVNDVVLASVAGAYRDLLAGRNERTAPDKLRILVPISMRSDKAKYLMDNRVTAVLPFLPIDMADPVERLNTIGERMSRHKSGGAAQAENSVLALAGLLPFAPLAWSLRLLARFPQRTVGALVTNVPGPRDQLTIRGRTVSEILPAVPIAMRVRTAVAVLSYADQLTFGITGDYDSAPDIAVLAEGIERDFRRLRERAGLRRPSRPEVSGP